MCVKTFSKKAYRRGQIAQQQFSKRHIQFSWRTLLSFTTLFLFLLHGTTLKQSEPHCKPAMDCTAAILKACAHSRFKWCRHKRSASNRPVFGCCCGRGGAAPGVISDASSLLERLSFYICCCRSSEESSELCRDWVDPPIGGRGMSEDEGEGEEFWCCSQHVSVYICISIEGFLSRSHCFTGQIWFFYGLNKVDDIIVVIFQTLINRRTTEYIIELLFRQPITLSQLTLQYISCINVMTMLFCRFLLAVL